MSSLILIVVSMLIIIAFFFASLLSYKAAINSKEKYLNDEKFIKIVKDKYAFTSIKLGTLISLALYYLSVYRLVNFFEINEYLNLFITTLGGTIVVVFISILSILKVSQKYYEIILKGFRKLSLFFKYILFPISYLYIIVAESVSDPNKTRITEEELLEFVEQAEEEKGINQNESQLIKSVLHFDELKVLDIYTPRVDLVVIEEGMSNEEIVAIFKSSGYSRLPIYRKSIDEIVGIINHKDFYNLVIIEKEELSKIIQKPVEVTEYMEVTNLLSMLKTNTAHMAIVKDEYGGTLGVVTMEDILEELVGDIWDEHDKVVQSIRQVDKNKYLVKGNAYLDDLIQELELYNIDGTSYVTVNGWVIANLRKIGKKGDSFTYSNLFVKVTKASEKKVLEVLIEKK